MLDGLDLYLLLGVQVPDTVTVPSGVHLAPGRPPYPSSQLPVQESSVVSAPQLKTPCSMVGPVPAHAEA